MPSVTMQQPNLISNGPTLEVHFLISKELEEKYKKEGKEIPKPVIVKALIDTGVSCCTIQNDIPSKLGLSPVGSTKINTPSCKDHSCFEYYMRMSIPSHNVFYQGTFISVPLEGQNIDCLIGRDLLQHGILIYIGQMNQFTLSLL